MLVTLNNGRTVSITWEKYDAMSDQEYKYFLDTESGENINDPFFQSQVDDRKRRGSGDDDFQDDHD